MWLKGRHIDISDETAHQQRDIADRPVGLINRDYLAAQLNGGGFADNNTSYMFKYGLRIDSNRAYAVVAHGVALRGTGKTAEICEQMASDAKFYTQRLGFSNLPGAWSPISIVYQWKRAKKRATTNMTWPYDA